MQIERVCDTIAAEGGELIKITANGRIYRVPYHVLEKFSKSTPVDIPPQSDYVIRVGLSGSTERAVKSHNLFYENSNVGPSVLVDIHGHICMCTPFILGVLLLDCIDKLDSDNFIDALGRLLKRLAEAGLHHNDLSPTNLFVVTNRTGAQDTYELLPIDWEFATRFGTNNPGLTGTPGFSVGDAAYDRDKYACSLMFFRHFGHSPWPPVKHGIDPVSRLFLDATAYATRLPDYTGIPCKYIDILSRWMYPR